MIEDSYSDFKEQTSNLYIKIIFSWKKLHILPNIDLVVITIRILSKI